MGVASAEDDEVVIVSVVEVPLAPGVTVLGEKLQAAFVGNPLQLKLTAFENDPPTEEMVNV